MRNFAAFILAGALVVVAMDLIAPPAGLGLAIGAWPDPPAAQTQQWVDRTFKGDRLDLPKSRVGASPSPAIEIPVGCESAFSPLADAHARNFARGCIG